MLWACLASLLMATRPASAVPETAVRDWYFRESLAAIRDWETLLGEREAVTPEDRRTPVLPVPEDASTVEWPNPIPATLIPYADECPTVQVRLAGNTVEVTRGTGTEAAAVGDTIPGYKHPGGGGKDHWYHAYHRRFDGLTQFRVAPAPFAVEITTPRDLVGDANTLSVGVRNATDGPINLGLRLTQRFPGSERPLEERTLTLAPQEETTADLAVHLTDEGGGLLTLTLTCGDREYWLPLLTHVERLSAAIEGVERILRDYPDKSARERLGRIRSEAEQGGAARRSLFEAASALRDELLLKRLPLDTLLFARRRPYDSEQPFMDAHHLINPPGGGIYRLSPVRPDGAVTPVVDSLGEGVYRDLCLHWDGSRLLFAFGNGSDQWDGAPSYHLYEANADGTNLRQLTQGTHNDAEPFYLPNGQIGFTSDRSEHFVMCGGNRHSPTLFVMEGDGSAPRQLSFNMFNDFSPSVLPDGRILYSRWEYNERSVTSLHKPFTMSPDGTNVEPYYGNATIRPNVVMFPRAVPGSRQVMGLFTAHHGQTHGPIGLIDVRKGIDGEQPLTLLTPNIPTTGEKAEDSRYGWFSDPQPLSEDTYLCSYTPTVVPWLPRTWALYVGDRHGNLALVYRDPAISCLEPLPLVPRPRPATLPPAPPDTDSTEATARLLLIDVHEGLPGVAPGEPKYLRVLEDVPRKSVKYGGVITTSGTRIYTIKRVFGTVPIEADGSACFTVPANRNVYFEVLDAEQREIQRMRSVVCLKPGETRTCVGCHEPKTTAPVNRFALAASRPPSEPSPPPWGTETLSFLRDVQPVLNDRCVSCHAFDRWTNHVLLTDDLTSQFTVGYEELLPYLSVADAMRWDHPDDVLPRPPYTYGSKVSPLMQLLAAGHHGVTLTEDERLRLATWIDANAVYYDRYENDHYPNRQMLTERVTKPMVEVYGRRCAECHGQGDGRGENWWQTLNRRDPRLSRALMAPLGREAGGWGRCDKAVFATTDDPDYRVLLAVLTDLAAELKQHPREDVASIAGTAAETQAVTLPEPPKTRPPADDLPDGWVWLSNLRWVSAASGWSPNGDKLPRLDRSIEGGPLAAGPHRHRKGLGTHAPSEIVYDLGGRYARLWVEAYAAESGGTVVFQVFGDDRCLFESGVLQGLRGSQEVDVPVEGVQRLRLVVTDAGDNYFADCASWAGARLLKAAGPR
jgi:hypothetical protein